MMFNDQMHHYLQNWRWALPDEGLNIIITYVTVQCVALVHQSFRFISGIGHIDKWIWNKYSTIGKISKPDYDL